MQRHSNGLLVGLLAILAACSSNSPGGGVPTDDSGTDVTIKKDVTQPADNPVPVDNPVPTDNPVPVDNPAPEDNPAPADVPTVDKPTPVDNGPPVDVPAPEDLPAPLDIPVPDVPVTPDVPPPPPDATCMAPETNCAGVCVNTQNDNTNCGTCGTACATGQNCLAGVCVTMCMPDQTLCAGRCVNTQSDGMNCGMCGRACMAGQMCAMGTCATACMAGQTLCGASSTNPGSCADLLSDSSNCGMCGRACPVGQTCQMGTCNCATGQTLCGATCINTQTDNMNCGACGRACPTGQTCAAGVCNCATGQTLCGTSCVNTMTDTANCGMCGRACPTGQTCTAGACTGGTTVANDNCATPTVINLASANALTIMGTTTGATQSANSCTANPDVFYQFTLTAREVVYFDTFGTAWDTYLGIQRPGCAAAATACADDSCGGLQTQIVQTLDPGTYLLVVDQFNTTGGAFTLHVQHYPAASGMSAALDLSNGMRRISGTLGTTAGAVNSGCCSGGSENMYVATTCPDFREVSFRATTCTLASFDTDLAFFSGNRAMNPVVCNDDSCGLQSLITGTIPAGAGLHVLYLDACSGNGPYGIDLTIGSACPTGQTACGTTCCAVGQVCAAGACRAPTTYTFATGTATFVDACALPGRTVQLASVDDTVGTATPIGFTFPFYGVAQTQVRPTSNGYFIFGAAAGANDNTYYPTMMLPDMTRPFPAVFVYNSDLFTRAGGVCLGLTGTAPARRFVIEGVDQEYYPSGTAAEHLTFEAILNEADGSMDFVYQTVTPAGDTHNNLVGLQNSGTVGVSYEYRAGANLTRVMTGTSLRVTPAP